MAVLRFVFCLFLFLSFSASYSQSARQLLKEGKTLRLEGKTRKAISKMEDALKAAESEKNTELQMSAHLELAELKDNVVNYKEALNHYKQFSLLYRNQSAQKTKMLEDSVSGLKSVVSSSYTEIEKKNSEIRIKENAIDSLTTEHLQSQLAIKDLELSNNKKELELQTSRNHWNILFFGFTLIVLIAAFIVRGYMLKRKGVLVLSQKNEQISREKQKSEELLLNILPETIADELKEHGRTTPCRHENASVMFTDFVGFTRFSEKHSPEELVQLVDHYFRAFDLIVKKYHIEKIKTIGDSYMCVAGIPESKENHAVLMVRAAFEFRDFVNKEAEEKQKKNQPFLRMRIGIHCGPLIAGVVGSRKFSYDVWGDTVNIAARMEQSGEADAINISESVHALIKDEFEVVYRGEIEAKNKGKLKMYFVSGEKKKNTNLHASGTTEKITSLN